MTIEKSLNHLEICTLLNSGNMEEALKLFLKNTKEFKERPENSYRTYLFSLNYNIYYYILFYQNISHHQCCYDNQLALQKCASGDLEKLGEKILLSYSYCIESPSESHKNPHIKKAMKYIHSHLSEPLSLEILSEKVNLNKYYLSSLFKTHTNTTFSEYVLMERIKLAKKLLKTTSLPLTTLAERCGFSSLSYFCTCFKKIVGTTPCNYKKEFF